VSQHHSGDCHIEALEKPLDRDALAYAQIAYLAVSGMGCPRCATRVNNSLLRLDGVLLSEIVLEKCLAVVAYDPEMATLSDLIQAVADAGNDGRHCYAARILVQMPAREALRVS
jgi:copper chaperone CopZ